MSDYIHLYGYAADPHIVEALTKHLLNAYNQFVDQYPGDVDYVDGFMAAHNFHKWIVLDLEKNSGDPAGVWRNAAVATFTNALDDPDGKGDP